MAEVGGHPPPGGQLKKRPRMVIKDRKVEVQLEDGSGSEPPTTPSALYCAGVVVGMLVLLGCAFIPPPFLGWFEPLRSVYLFFFRTRKNLQMMFVVANLIHLGLAAFAFFLARRVDSLHATSWFWKTFIFGHGSFKLLLLRRHDQTPLGRKE